MLEYLHYTEIKVGIIKDIQVYSVNCSACLLKLFFSSNTMLYLFQSFRKFARVMLRTACLCAPSNKFTSGHPKCLMMVLGSGTS